MEARYIANVNNRPATGYDPSEAGAPVDRSGKVTNHNIEKHSS